MDEVVRYTYRLRPGARAEAALVAEWHRCRFLWNEAVHQQRSGRLPTMTRLSKLLTEARGRSTWLREGSQVAQQQTLRSYMAALDASYRVPGRGRPKIHSRKTTSPSLEYTLRGFSVKGTRLHLPRGVTVPVVWSRDLPSDPTSVRVYRDSLGHWYASFVVRREVPEATPVEGGIGVDWGVTTTATTTDPAYDLAHGGHRKKSAAEMAKAQRKMARRRRGKGKPQSKGYREAKRQAAKVQKKAARQNRHDSRVWAKRVVDNHQLIAVEDFMPRFLASSTMARKAADAAVGSAKRELIERATRARRDLVLVAPAYTTMTCSQCDARAKHRLGLSERTFRCEACGHTDDRDRNAARTILAMAERNHAGADGVRRLEPTPVGAETQPEPGTSAA